jgi:quercetin dioxygenase-like cupin family protein
MSEILLDTCEVASLPWRPFAGEEGVRDRVLWQDPDGASYAGLLDLEPGASVAPHLHRGAVHHLWVVSGHCEIGGRTLGAGSYVFVPGGAEHAIQRAGPTGCVLFYLYLRMASATDDAHPAHKGRQAVGSDPAAFVPSVVN